MCFGTHEFLEVDEELRLLIPKRSKEERDQLEANILADGEIRDPIIVWDRIVIDGMGRFEIARKHKLPFHIKRKEFSNNAECKAWMYRNQLGRRNLTETSIRLMRGDLYNITKDEHGGDRKSKDQPDTLIAQEPTAMELAKSFGTGSATIKRDGKLAESVKNMPEEVAHAVVNHEVKADRKDIEELAAKPPAEQKKIVKKVKSGKARSVKEALHPAPEPEAEHWLDPLQEPYEKAVKSIQEARRHVKAVSLLEKDGAHLAHLGTFNHIKKNLDEAETHVKANKPAAGCPKCGDDETRGKGCKSCYGCGFISQVVHKGLTAKVG